MAEIKWRELVAKTKQGDTKAFEELYNETKRSVYFTALKMLANEENAKDVMQDTFVTAIEKLNDLEDSAKFPIWINSIAVNKCRRYFRKQAVDSLDEQFEQGFEIKDDESFIPEEYVSNEVKRKVVMDIITNSLSDVQRQTIIMYYYNEMSLDDIAEVMECPAKTVSSRLCSAREKIREAVLIYEKKQGDRLHAVAPVPILAIILRMEAEKLSVPDIPLEFFTKVLIDAVSKAAATNTAIGTAAGSSAAAGTVSTGGAVANMISGKIIAGILAVTIAGGGTAAVIYNRNKNADEKQDTSASEVSISETVTEMPTTTSEATGWICDECGIVNYGKFCSNCGKPKPDNAQTANSSEPTESLAPYVPLNNKLNPEMQAKLDELRAKGAETVEVKWGTKTPSPFTEASTGEKVEVRCNGKFTYFPEVNGDMDEDTLKAHILMCIQPVIAHRSGYLDAEQLPAEGITMEDEVIAELANEYGILLDSLNIASITKPQKQQ